MIEIMLSQLLSNGTRLKSADNLANDKMFWLWCWLGFTKNTYMQIVSEPEQRGGAYAYQVNPNMVEYKWLVFTIKTIDTTKN